MKYLFEFFMNAVLRFMQITARKRRKRIQSKIDLIIIKHRIILDSAALTLHVLVVA